MLKKILPIIMLILCNLQIQSISQNNIFPHSICYDTGREAVSTKMAYNSQLIDDESFGQFTIFYTQQKSFKNDRNFGLGSLFTWSNSNSMTVGGSSSATYNVTGTEDLDLYQFGLGEREAGGDRKVSFTPKIVQRAANIFFAAGYKKHRPGFWMKIQTNVGSTSVDPQMVETGTFPNLVNAGIYYPAGTFGNATAILDDDGNSSLTESFNGERNIHTNVLALNQGKIDGIQNSTEKLGDIIASIGYNFYADTRNFCGVGFHFITPTGNKPFNDYAFEPLFGNAGHWGIGAEFNSKIVFWSIEAAHAYIQVWLDMKLRHLFPAEQTRSFDLTENGEGSRYMLVAGYGNSTTYTSLGAANEFLNEISHLIKYSTIACQSAIPTEFEGSFMIELTMPNISISVGYELWYRAQEQLNLTGEIHPSLVVIGRQRVADPHGLPLGYCQPSATMKSQDAAQLAQNTETDNIKYANRSTSKIQCNDDLDVLGATARAAHASKIFLDITYKQKQNNLLPNIGLYAAVEFGTSRYNSIDQWSIGGHCGIAF